LRGTAVTDPHTVAARFATLTAMCRLGASCTTRKRRARVAARMRASLVFGFCRQMVSTDLRGTAVTAQNTVAARFGTCSWLFARNGALPACLGALTAVGRLTLCAAGLPRLSGASPHLPRGSHRTPGVPAAVGLGVLLFAQLFQPVAALLRPPGASPRLPRGSHCTPRVTAAFGVGFSTAARLFPPAAGLPRPLNAAALPPRGFCPRGAPPRARR